MTNLLSRTRDKYHTKLNLEPLRAIIGDENDVIYDNVVLNSGRVYIRYETSNGYSVPVLVRGPYQSNVPLLPGQACMISYDVDAMPYVSSVDFGTTQAGGGSPTPIQPPADGAYVPQDRIVTLRCSQTIPASMSVSISGWKPIIDRTVYAFGGTVAFDLTSFLPATSTHCAVGIFIKSDMLTPEAFASTAIPINDPLGDTDINAVLALATVGSTPSWFYDLSGDALAVYDFNMLIDARQIVNTSRVYAYTPSGSADTAGLTGDLSFDNSFVYVKAAGGWRRAALSTF